VRKKGKEEEGRGCDAQSTVEREGTGKRTEGKKEGLGEGRERKEESCTVRAL